MSKLMVPFPPTREMVDAGASRLASYEDNSKWPDSWSPGQVATMRREAERVLRSGIMAAQEKGEQTLLEEVGWLVELFQKDQPLAKWWSLTLPEDEDGQGWTTDSATALRFARKVDAQAYIDATGWTAARPTEHLWS